MGPFGWCDPPEAPVPLQDTVDTNGVISVEQNT